MAERTTGPPSSRIEFVELTKPHRSPPQGPAALDPFAKYTRKEEKKSQEGTT